MFIMVHQQCSSQNHQPYVFESLSASEADCYSIGNLKTVTMRRTRAEGRRRRKSREGMKKRQKRRKKSVSFAPRVKVRPTLLVDEYSDAEYCQCWLDENDTSRIRQEIAHTLVLMEHNAIGGPNNKWSDHTTRGLEGRTKEGTKQRKVHRRQAKQAVFAEQDEQTERGVRNDYKLSLIYTSMSYTSQIHAHMLALQDEEITARERQQEQDILHEENKKFGKSIVDKTTCYRRTTTRTNSNNYNTNTNTNTTLPTKTKTKTKTKPTILKKCSSDPNFVCGQSYWY